VRFVADLHIHSHLSRATSKALDLEHLHLWAQRKGITVVATGDFTHPRWFAELRDKLVPSEPGLFRLRDDLARAVDATVPAACARPVRFVLSVEVSSIYSKAGRTRKVHNLIYAPDFEAAAQVSSRLARLGNIASDGRPILGVDSRDMLDITLQSSPDAFLVPAHVWTPWFSALGSQSGFDSIDDCFGDLASHVFAVETGLSSDPAMNWRLSQLDRFALISSSDAHSPEKLGREANLFDGELSYFAMRDALRTRSSAFLGTVEFFPEEGKYHYDGHRKCGVVVDPEEAAACGQICRVCGKKLTGGVMGRVAELADRPPGFRPASAKSFSSLVPLCEVLGELLGVGPATARVRQAYDRLIGRVGSELDVLMHVPVEDAAREAPPLFDEALRRMRAGQVKLSAGYDGEYGVVRMFDVDERERLLSQLRFGFAGVVASAPKENKAAPVPRPASAVAPVTLGEDEGQAAAIAHTSGPLLITAGPGAGKTRTLVQRIARLVREGQSPSGITAITFTRKAAAELRERLQTLLGDEGHDLRVLTFHALGLELLRAHSQAAGLPDGFTVLDEPARQAILDRISDDLKVPRLAHEISRAKAALVTPDAPEIAAAYARYESELNQRGAVDFDDLVNRAVRLLQADTAALQAARTWCQHLLVDEYQDINAAQYALVRLLAGSESNLCVVGDPDQAIYGFRGSDPGYFARFATDYPDGRAVTLAHNYRSAGHIVELARTIIERAPQRVPRPQTALLSAGPASEFHVLADERAEADFIAAEIEALVGGTQMHASGGGGAAQSRDSALPFSEIAVLVRLTAQGDVIEEALGARGIPCHRVGDEAITRRTHAAEILARLQADWARDPAPLLADRLPALVPEAAIDDGWRRTRELLVTLAVPFRSDGAAFFAEMALVCDTDLASPPQKVSLLTLHASKGLEFAAVFIPGCEDQILPLGLPGLDRADVDEERRILYVGITRARTRLVLSAARTRRLMGRTVEAEPSRFLDAVAPALLQKKIAGNRRPRARQLSLLT
jgi:uncharacterized protein (TIGR00375 family)